MRISKPVVDVIVDQLHHELDASYRYLGMAAYFDGQDLPGFASWFRAHSQEETDHAMRLYGFLASCGAQIRLKALDAPTVEFESPEAVIAAALEHEQKVTDQIKNIFRVATEAQEYTVHPMLHWFLNEQVEEEDLFSNVLNRVQAAASRFDLLTLDQELGQRPAPKLGDEDGE